MKQLKTVERTAVALAARQELARRTPLELAKLLIPGFHDAAHLRHLAELLVAIERGDLRRLLVTLHPGSGKSTLLQVFASWYLGRGPRRKIIGASAGAELAERNSGASRAFFTEAFWPFDIDLSQDTKAMNRWSTTEGGQYMAVGVDGLITGWRGNLIICDDLLNSAGSKGERDSTWDWFRERLMGRLEPNGAIVVIQQRWSEDDIPGASWILPTVRNGTLSICRRSPRRESLFGQNAGRSRS